MRNTDHIGVFYQGQIISFVITNSDDATEEEKAILKDNYVYTGVYSTSPLRKLLFSEKDGTIKKVVRADGTVELSFIISASETKKMLGHYSIELLIKDDDNTFTAPCENSISFDVKTRNIAEVIDETLDENTNI